MLLKVFKLIRQDISIWHNIEGFPPIAFLHLDHIVAESIFASDLITGGEVVNFLVLIQTFVKIGLATRRTPHYVPLMAFGVPECVRF
jgi:hypothetical protein